jgi:membrane-bound lytic murein transglycosylase MltF
VALPRTLQAGLLGFLLLSVCQGVRQRPSQTADLYRFDERALHIAHMPGGRFAELPHWERIEWAQALLDACEEARLDPLLVLAVIQVESSFDPCAVSKVGAKGLMQVMPRRLFSPDDFADYAFQHHRFYEPVWNVRTGVAYLASLRDRFGDLETALAAYNAGPTRVSASLAENPGGSRYVRAVMNRFQGVRRDWHQRI